MNSRKLILVTVSVLALGAGGYLLLQLQKAFAEYSHWQSREAVLEKELEDLRLEAKNLREFLERLQRPRRSRCDCTKRIGLWQRRRTPLPHAPGNRR